LAARIRARSPRGRSQGLRRKMSDDPTPPPDDLRSACARVIAAIDIGGRPLLDDVTALRDLCDWFIADHRADTQRIVREILDAVFGTSDAEPAP
jgi:hypothetical protein